MSSSNTQSIRASHILLKHEGSRNTSSWKDLEGYVIKNTTKESTIAQLKAMRVDILSGKASFNGIASRYSHCTSAKRGGDLGCIKRGKMLKPFEKVAFALNVDQVSDVVETESGVHIIKRTQ